MESLMQVMAAKKRELSTVKENKSEKKYMRRGEIEDLLYAREKQQQEQEKNEAAASKKRKLETTASDGKKRRDLNERTETTDADNSVVEEETAILSWAEMRRRLRELDEPITLFGETKRDRMERLRRAENDAALRREDELGDGHATHNEFVGHTRGLDNRGVRADARDDVDDDDDDDDHGQMDDHKDKSSKTTSDASTENNGDEEEKDDVKVIYHFFKSMLRRWEQDLAVRPDHIRRTAQGKIATKTMKQCKDYIRPLFKLCKKREVPLDILPSLAEIVRFCKEGEFVQANDAYIKLAIGNAAWPIGVTMVGIHERTGREKINANKQAHVMNNEAQRKYITSVKRLISYAQSVSNVLPSKKVS